MKLLIGIPAFNEEKMIVTVIKSIRKQAGKIGKPDILVVDDGSEDATAKYAGKQKVTVLRHIINRGLGGALKTIFAYAKLKGYDILVTFDADGQHNAKDLKKLIDPVLKGKTDVVIGTRWAVKNKVPFSRLIINKAANIVTYLLYGVMTSDSQSGFRVFGKDAIGLISLQNDGMEVSSEIFKEINRNKLHFTEVPIEAIYTDYSVSKGQRLSNAVNILVQLLLRLLN